MSASSSSFHPKVQEAVNVVHADDAGDLTGIAYRVARAEYPDQWTHEIDLSDVPNEHQHSASVRATEELAKRGFVVKSVQFAAQRLHVERVECVLDDWLDRHRGVRATADDLDLLDDRGDC